VGDSFWIEDEVGVGWEQPNKDWENIFDNTDRSALRNTLSFMDFQIKEYVFQKSKYPMSNTGSEILDPVWRRSVGKVKSGLTRIQVFISLN
jgi:hypothetical protein